MAIMVGVSNLMFSATFSIFVLFALERLGVGEVGFGLLMASNALGSVLGSLTAHRIAKLLGLTVALIGSVLVLGLGLFGVALTTSIPVIVALFVIMGLANMIWNVITVSLRQSLIPDRLLGRVNSVYRLLAWGTMPVGAGIGGLLASTLELASPFLIGGVVIVVMGVLAVPIVNSTEVKRARAAVGV
jgi:MFS family permease